MSPHVPLCRWTQVKAKIDVLNVDVTWIKLIAGGILAVLILPWLAQPGASVIN